MTYSPSLETDDVILPFHINETPLRGRVVRLSAVLDEILNKHAYPLPISQLLGEMLVLVSLLGDTLKCEGVMTLQAQTDGIIKLLVADYTAGGKLRGYARINEERYNALDEPQRMHPSFKELLGEGYLVLTVNQGSNTDLYQGIVELAGANLCECVESYFRQSEQLATVLKIAVGQIYDGSGGMKWRGGGIMVQSLPATAIEKIENGHEAFDEQWNKTEIFVASVMPDELLDPCISLDKLLLRLFHEEGVWKHEASKLTHGCRCSREKAYNILKNLSTEEINFLKINEEIVVTCQFCNKEEIFTEKMLEEKEGK